jgi:subtilisin family serine protease
MPDSATMGQLALSVPVLLVVFGYLIHRERRQREAEDARDQRRREEELARDARHRELVIVQQEAAQSVADRHERITEKITSTFDQIVERHEGVEKEERAERREMAREVALATTAAASATSKMADAVRGLTRQLGHTDDTFNHLAHEVHAMSHEFIYGESGDVDGDVRPGVPGGVPSPIFMNDAELQSMDLMTESRPWTHAVHGVTELHALSIKGDPRVLIAVLDTGVDTDHPDLAHVDLRNSRSFVVGESLEDLNGHGTHCTGSVTGNNEAIRRIMGVAHGCTVRHYKVLSNRGSGSGQGIAAAIRAVADLPGFMVKIISGSFGSGGEDPTISAAVRYAHSKGVVQIYAAGNSGPNSPNWPGMLPECIAVGASDRNGNVAAFSSSKDDYVDVTAGGVDVPSCYPGGRTAVLSGTSMATPLVAGGVGVGCGFALAKTGLAPTDAEVKDALYTTCTPHTRSGRDSRGGFGRVNLKQFADKLVELVAKRKPADPKPVDPKPVDPTPDPDKTVRIAVPPGAKFLILDFAN